MAKKKGAKKIVTDKFIQQLAMEGELLKGAEQLRADSGDDAFEEFMIELILPYEKELRDSQPADHPALLLLDEWRADHKWSGK